MTGATPGFCYPLTSIWWLSEGKCSNGKFSGFDDYNRLPTLYSYLLLLISIIISYDIGMCTSSLLTAAAGCKPARLVSSLCFRSVHPFPVRSTFLLLVGGYSYTKLCGLCTWGRYFTRVCRLFDGNIKCLHFPCFFFTFNLLDCLKYLAHGNWCQQQF